MNEEMSAQGRLRGLASRASPLIDWYKRNKPKVTWVRVTDEELGLLRKFPDIAKSYGFNLKDDGIYLEDFEVIGVSGSPTHCRIEESMKWKILQYALGTLVVIAMIVLISATR